MLQIITLSLPLEENLLPLTTKDGVTHTPIQHARLDIRCLSSIGQHREDGTSSSSAGLSVGLAMLLALASGGYHGLQQSQQEAPAAAPAPSLEKKPGGRTHTPIVYTIASYPGNEHIEDRYEAREIDGGDFVCGIFDGHGKSSLSSSPPSFLSSSSLVLRSVLTSHAYDISDRRMASS